MSRLEDDLCKDRQHKNAYINVNFSQTYYTAENITHATSFLKRFGKIEQEQDCHPQPIKQTANGPGNHWLIHSSTIIHVCVTRPCEIFVNFCFVFYLRLTILALLAFIQSVDSLFHSFIALCENVCFQISNIHCYFMFSSSSIFLKCDFYQYFHNYLIS